MNFSTTKKKHCYEILNEVCEKVNIELEEAHYTVEGIEATVIDKYDGQKYKLTIVPEKSEQ